MASTHFWIHFGVRKVVTVVPGASQWVENVKVVEALSMGTRSTEQIKFLPYVAKRHAGSRCGTFTFHKYL
jgi:hypothetical protein